MAMPTDDIKLSMAQDGPSGELSVIRVDGTVDTITASELEEAVEGLLKQSKYRIIIDLGGVEYISSAGWGIFISKIREIRENKGDIKLINMIPNVYEIYELLEFENIIEAFDNLDQARRAFNVSEGGGPVPEKSWKTEERIVVTEGNAVKSALAPGTKNARPNNRRSPSPGQNQSPVDADDLIKQLIIEDPFCTISELKELARDHDSSYAPGWWQIFSILRRNNLLSRRARFRFSRRHSRAQ
jgi:anti-anti-sigma factor